MTAIYFSIALLVTAAATWLAAAAMRNAKVWWRCPHCHRLHDGIITLPHGTRRKVWRDTVLRCPACQSGKSK